MVSSREAQGGKFQVKRVVYALLPGQESQGPKEDLSLCLISGLDLGGEGGDWLAPAQVD